MTAGNVRGNKGAGDGVLMGMGDNTVSFQGLGKEGERKIMIRGEAP